MKRNIVGTEREKLITVKMIPASRVSFVENSHRDQTGYNKAVASVERLDSCETVFDVSPTRRMQIDVIQFEPVSRAIKTKQSVGAGQRIFVGHRKLTSVARIGGSSSYIVEKRHLQQR